MQHLNPKFRALATPALAVIFALTLAACGPDGNSQAAEAEDEKEEAVSSVRAEIPRQDRVSANHRATATLQAISDARVISRATGLVRELHVEEGDRVEEGQVLAMIDDARLRLEVERARTRVSRLEQEYRRHRELNAQQLVSSDEVERLSFELAAQRAELGLAELELEETRIKAPFTGVVSERSIRRGDHVANGDAVFRVTDVSRLEAEVHVPERLLARLAPEQLVEIVSDTAPDRRYTGRINRISPVVDAATGTVKATVVVDSGNGLLRPGAFARVRILYDTRDDALLVPRQALLFQDGEASLFVVEDGVAKRRKVSTGYSEEGWVEITEGLSAGEQVVTLGHATLRDGARVRINGREKSRNEIVAENGEV
jgi:RND family efflux transporter MFP subunit